MAQNFYMAIVACGSCFVFTVLISLATRQTKTDVELAGLTYATTPRPEKPPESWVRRPGVLAAAVLGVTLVLNWVFR
jgi:SSS family solute:Na+ symporter